MRLKNMNYSLPAYKIFGRILRHLGQIQYDETISEIFLNQKEIANDHTWNVSVLCGASGSLA